MSLYASHKRLHKLIDDAHPKSNRSGSGSINSKSTSAPLQQQSHHHVRTTMAPCSPPIDDPWSDRSGGAAERRGNILNKQAHHHCHSPPCCITTPTIAHHGRMSALLTDKEDDDMSCIMERYASMPPSSDVASLCETICSMETDSVANDTTRKERPCSATKAHDRKKSLKKMLHVRTKGDDEHNSHGGDDDGDTENTPPLSQCEDIVSCESNDDTANSTTKDGLSDDTQTTDKDSDDNDAATVASTVPDPRSLPHLITAWYAALCAYWNRDSIPDAVLEYAEYFCDRKKAKLKERQSHGRRYKSHKKDDSDDNPRHSPREQSSHNGQKTLNNDVQYRSSKSLSSATKNCRHASLPSVTNQRHFQSAAATATTRTTSATPSHLHQNRYSSTISQATCDPAMSLASTTRNHDDPKNEGNPVVGIINEHHPQDDEAAIRAVDALIKTYTDGLCELRAEALCIIPSEDVVSADSFFRFTKTSYSTVGDPNNSDDVIFYRKMREDWKDYISSALDETKKHGFMSNLRTLAESHLLRADRVIRVANEAQSRMERILRSHRTYCGYLRRRRFAVEHQTHHERQQWGDHLSSSSLSSILPNIANVDACQQHQQRRHLCANDPPCSRIHVTQEVAEVARLVLDMEQIAASAIGLLTSNARGRALIECTLRDDRSVSTYDWIDTARDNTVLDSAVVSGVLGTELMITWIDLAVDIAEILHTGVNIPAIMRTLRLAFDTIADMSKVVGSHHLNAVADSFGTTLKQLADIVSRCRNNVDTIANRDMPHGAAAAGDDARITASRQCHHHLNVLNEAEMTMLRHAVLQGRTGEQSLEPFVMLERIGHSIEHCMQYVTTKTQQQQQQWAPPPQETCAISTANHHHKNVSPPSISHEKPHHNNTIKDETALPSLQLPFRSNRSNQDAATTGDTIPNAVMQHRNDKDGGDCRGKSEQDARISHIRHTRRQNVTRQATASHYAVQQHSQCEDERIKEQQKPIQSPAPSLRETCADSCHISTVSSELCHPNRHRLIVHQECDTTTRAHTVHKDCTASDHSCHRSCTMGANDAAAGNVNMDVDHHHNATHSREDRNTTTTTQHKPRNTTGIQSTKTVVPLDKSSSGRDDHGENPWSIDENIRHHHPIVSLNSDMIVDNAATANLQNSGHMDQYHHGYLTSTPMIHNDAKMQHPSPSTSLFKNTSSIRSAIQSLLFARLGTSKPKKEPTATTRPMDTRSAAATDHGCHIAPEEQHPSLGQKLARIPTILPSSQPHHTTPTNSHTSLHLGHHHVRSSSCTHHNGTTSNSITHARRHHCTHDNHTATTSMQSVSKSSITTHRSQDCGTPDGSSANHTIHRKISQSPHSGSSRLPFHILSQIAMKRKHQQCQHRTDNKTASNPDRQQCPSSTLPIHTIVSHHRKQSQRSDTSMSPSHYHQIIGSKRQNGRRCHHHRVNAPCDSQSDDDSCHESLYPSDDNETNHGTLRWKNHLSHPTVHRDHCHQHTRRPLQGRQHITIRRDHHGNVDDGGGNEDGMIEEPVPADCDGGERDAIQDGKSETKSIVHDDGIMATPLASLLHSRSFTHPTHDETCLRTAVAGNCHDANVLQPHTANPHVLQDHRHIVNKSDQRDEQVMLNSFLLQETMHHDKDAVAAATSHCKDSDKEDLSSLWREEEMDSNTDDDTTDDMSMMAMMQCDRSSSCHRQTPISPPSMNHAISQRRQHSPGVTDNNSVSSPQPKSPPPPPPVHQDLQGIVDHDSHDESAAGAHLPLQQHDNPAQSTSHLCDTTSPASFQSSLVMASEEHHTRSSSNMLNHHVFSDSMAIHTNTATTTTAPQSNGNTLCGPSSISSTQMSPTHATTMRDANRDAGVATLCSHFDPFLSITNISAPRDDRSSTSSQRTLVAKRAQCRAPTIDDDTACGTTMTAQIT